MVFFYKRGCGWCLNLPFSSEGAPYSLYCILFTSIAERETKTKRDHTILPCQYIYIAINYIFRGIKTKCMQVDSFFFLIFVNDFFFFLSFVKHMHTHYQKSNDTRDTHDLHFTEAGCRHRGKKLQES